MSQTAPDGPLILIKYGGNAMLNEQLKQRVVENIHKVSASGARIVLVHGGGPFIQKILELAKIESEFIAGHRKTTPEALRYIEMALKGEVNGSLVNLLNRTGLRAVGLSGKDGRMVRAQRRYHRESVNGWETQTDLGLVGNVKSIDPSLIRGLLDGGFLPVVTCLASDERGDDYNINADMFAGHLAGALGADRYLVLTDVDGVLTDIDDPNSLLPELRLTDLKEMMGTVIRGGMIPKLESCQIALEKGAREACIINGTKPEQLLVAALENEISGTIIKA